MKQIVQDLDILPSEPTAEEKAACDLPRVTQELNTGKQRKLYIESYGCQMNFSDSEIVMSILTQEGFDTTSTPDNADVILLNTCSIRDNAEQKVRNRLVHFKGLKRNKPSMIVGVLGCMAERLKEQILEEEKIVDMVVGPDAYRDLPNLINEVDSGHKAVNVFLSREETYADICPLRLSGDGVSAFVSIMRGCDNMCSFCVVPYTRGRERSRDADSILKEVTELVANGYKEVTLLGQNVDSYKWSAKDASEKVTFAQLLERVALVDSDLRVRFSTSHPKDITDEVLYTMKKYNNICNSIHLPAQSGNTRILELMNRTYTREWYMERITKIREILGNDCGISSDTIAGFCSETEEEHQDTLSLMKFANFDFGYQFVYSERSGTPAAKKLADDVPDDVKQRRLTEIIVVQRQLSLEHNQAQIGTVQRILIEGVSKKSENDLKGRNSRNMMAIFPKKNYTKGQYVDVLITGCSGGTLFGEIVEKV
ncbi:tRNA (N6-isopentenyl adenosine(37)-C2)-methylthiotransferase MiaB [uncultured Cytophaga sp.]|uniref:tRNA (N6-isopentenyl adenosine(37)-C2)-methylthiotransferase MiaB n=1 Tax=uncultured Cytophaga sp. TaxID=160238 RepID=UPI002629BABF|nr:tRNA (N6-isopentenyl adenosine(37)-C2)-methylthiotransferase MiaB [uncultured Cytophaga sp.]